MLETYEIELKTSKSVIRTALIDPFLFSGVMGHVNILQVLDRRTAEYVAPGKLSEPGVDYRVLYVFGTPDTKLHTVLGYMKGPELEGNSVLFSGKSDDHKFEWKAHFYVDDAPAGSKIKIGLEVNYKTSTLDRLIGKSPFELAQHIIQDHIIPYLKLYLNKEQQISQDQGIFANEVMRIEGDIAELITKIRQLIDSINSGCIVSKGKNVRASIQVLNKRPGLLKMVRGNQIITGNDVLANLILESGEAVAVAYDIDTERILDITSEQISRTIEITGKQ